MSSRQPMVTLVGGGSWGTTLGSLAARSTATTLWLRKPEVAEPINERPQNPRGITQFPEGVKSAAADMEYAVRMPITGVMGTAINDGQTVTRTYRRLLRQSPGNEFRRGHSER